MKIRKTLAEITLDCFGPDLGRELLALGAIHPILGSDRKNPGFVGHNLPFRDISTTRFEALGLTAGERSGLTVWDIDSKLLEYPVAPNVLTRRGVHIYSPYVGEAHLQPGVSKLDVISNGNVAFWDGNIEKTFVHARLADPKLMHDFFASKSGAEVRLFPHEKRTSTRISLTSREARVTSTRARGSAGDYPARVERAGYVLDLARIERGCVLQLRSAKAGSRNTVLHRKSITMIQCGLDPWRLEAAALASGLKPEEVTKTIDAAISSFDPKRAPEVMEDAEDWAVTARDRSHPRLHGVIEGLVRMAVQQNTTSPLVVQHELSATVNRSTTSRRLDRLVALGLLVKKPMGTRPSGLVRSNCYRLARPEAAPRPTPSP